MKSMTGFGKALARDERRDVEVEVRSVNNRFMKTQLRLARQVQALEPELETLLRSQIDRGSVTLAVRIEERAVAADFRLDRGLIKRLHEESRELASELGLSAPDDLSAYLRIPGVLIEDAATHEDDAEALSALVRDAVSEALNGLVSMRETEGATLARDLRLVTSRISESLTAVRARAPEVVDAYREKLHQRLSAWVEERGATVEDADLLREVAAYADRSDIAEEMQRLASHLDQFESLLDEDGVGRKLDFLAQEMLREVNTIGSKSSDLTLAHAVVEMKAELEKLREQAQNVE